MKLNRRSFLATLTITPAVARISKVPIRPSVERTLETVDEGKVVCDSVRFDPEHGTVDFLSNGEVIHSLDPGFGYEFIPGTVMTINDIEIRLTCKLVSP